MTITRHTVIKFVIEIALIWAIASVSDLALKDDAQSQVIGFAIRLLIAWNVITLTDKFYPKPKARS